MAKSVLVMNTPDNCLDCLFAVEIDEGVEACCSAKNDDIDGTSMKEIDCEGGYCQGKPDWCPLNPLPEKLELSERDAERVSNGETVANSVSFKSGWNMCIDEITGGIIND